MGLCLCVHFVCILSIIWNLPPDSKHHQKPRVAILHEMKTSQYRARPEHLVNTKTETEIDCLCLVFVLFLLVTLTLKISFKVCCISPKVRCRWFLYSECQKFTIQNHSPPPPHVWLLWTLKVSPKLHLLLQCDSHSDNFAQQNLYWDFLNSKLWLLNQIMRQRQQFLQKCFFWMISSKNYFQ